jgi:hypothetical protein
MSRRKVWRVWAKALGQKDGKDDRESDTIAGIRTIIFITYLVTNVAIVANAVRHWNDVPSELSQTKEERLCKTNSNLSKD